MLAHHHHHFNFTTPLRSQRCYTAKALIRYATLFGHRSTLWNLPLDLLHVYTFSLLINGMISCALCGHLTIVSSSRWDHL